MPLATCCLPALHLMWRLLAIVPLENWILRARQPGLEHRGPGISGVHHRPQIQGEAPLACLQQARKG